MPCVYSRIGFLQLIALIMIMFCGIHFMDIPFDNIVASKEELRRQTFLLCNQRRVILFMTLKIQVNLTNSIRMASSGFLP